MVRAIRLSFERWTRVLRLGIILFCLIQIGGWIHVWLFPEPFSWTQRLLGLLVDGIGLGALFISMWSLFCLFSVAQREQLFTIWAAQKAQKTFIFFLIWTAYTPFAETLDGLIATLHNPVGARLLLFGFSTGDLVRLVILAGLAVFVFVIQQAALMREDQSLTV